MKGSSLFAKNIALFKARFPNMAVEGCVEDRYEFLVARNGSMTAREGGVLLHSLYDPEREAEKLVAGDSHGGEMKHSAIFSGFGLGYGPAAWVKRHKGQDGALILIESDKARFFEALKAIDWEGVFAWPHLVIALECPLDQIIPLILSVAEIRECEVFAVPSHTAHDKPYFDAVQSLIVRNKRKEDINDATTKRFARLWLTNVCRNAILLDAACPLAKKVLGRGFAALPSPAPCVATILAAGPSLEAILPRLREIKKHSIVIAVDTSLRAALRAGVEPDYIVLSDPQYYAWKHIAGLSSPSSTLVTDLSVYPPVLRFDCKQVVLTKSAIPFAQYFEGLFESSLQAAGGDIFAPSLGAGGSVSSCAWNLALLLGAKEIYIAGLDLSFPRGLSHVKGSTAEEEVHTLSTRLCNAETASIPRLISGAAERGEDYNGQEVATDSRMKMFAWWFESRLAEVSAAGEDVKTYTLCPAGLRIPGIETADISKLLSWSTRGEEAASEASDCPAGTGVSSCVLDTFKDDMDELGRLAREAESAVSEKQMRECAQAMKANALMAGLFFTPLRFDPEHITLDALKMTAEKTLDALALLTDVAKRSHIL